LLLTIEKQIYGGEGLARLPADADSRDRRSKQEHARGKAVFVPFVLEGEKIEATITEQKPGFARATAGAIVEPSPHRIQPACPYFARCGGCHYQHASYEHQLEIKKEILRETLRRTAKLELATEIEVHPSPPWNYRNRSHLQVQTAPQFAVGYFKHASHELLAVEQCPISSPLINRGLAALWQSGRAGKVPAGVREVEFFANADDSRLLVEVQCDADARRASVRAWIEEFAAPMPEIAGVVAVREGQSTGKHKTAEKFLSLGENHLSYQSAHATYRVSAGSFFQTNRYLTDELVKIVTQGQSGQLALDLYAGVGLFSTALRGFNQTISVESSQTSSADLAYNLSSNGVAVQATTEQYLAGAGKSGRVATSTSTNLPPAFGGKPDLVVVDPPRSGLGDRVARMLANLDAPRVTYVSCDPATLARDLLTLVGAGYRPEQVHLVDLFPQTFHLETVVHLMK
jgi:23S rRNA (uracil1939-C5)-methyltransferase